MSRPDHPILMIVAVIFALGLIMIFSTTSADLLDHAHDEGIYHPLVKQLTYAAAGILLAWGTCKAGMARWLELSPVLLALFSFLLLLVLLPGIGREVNGAKRWLNLFGTSFQPSEFMKFILPLYVVHAYRAAGYSIKTFRECLKLLAPLAVPIGLILLEPNNGTVLLLMGELTALLFILGLPKRFWVLPLTVIGCIALGAAALLPYFSGRIEVFLHPEKDLLGRGHQPYQAKIAVGSGGFLGSGPGNSWQKLSYLPEAQNDYIAAIFAEEFGFAGIMALILLFMGLAAAMARRIMDIEDRAAFCTCASIMAVLIGQAFLNLAVVSGLAPSTGLNLPFFSQGGSSLMANLVGIGLFLSYRSENEEEKMRKSHLL